MHTMQSVDDCTTLLSNASRRRMPSASANERHMRVSNQRTEATANSKVTTSMGATVAITSRCCSHTSTETAAMEAYNSASTSRLRRQFELNNSHASSAVAINRPNVIHEPAGRRMPALTVSAAIACTSVPGICPKNRN